MMEDQMLTRLALALSLSLAAAGVTHAAIPRHEATGLLEERAGTVIEKGTVSPVPAPVIAEAITPGTVADTRS